MHHEQDLRKVDLQMFLSRLQWFVENCRALLNVRLEKRGVKLHLGQLWWLSSWSGWYGQQRSEVQIPLAMYSEHLSIYQSYFRKDATKRKRGPSLWSMQLRLTECFYLASIVRSLMMSAVGLIFCCSLLFNSWHFFSLGQTPPCGLVT